MILNKDLMQAVTLGCMHEACKLDNAVALQVIMGSWVLFSNIL